MACPARCSPRATSWQPGARPRCRRRETWHATDLPVPSRQEFYASTGPGIQVCLDVFCVIRRVRNVYSLGAGDRDGCHFLFRDHTGQIISKRDLEVDLDFRACLCVLCCRADYSALSSGSSSAVCVAADTEADLP